MKVSTAITTSLVAIASAPLAFALPVNGEAINMVPSSKQNDDGPPKRPWQIFSLREQPYTDSSLTFVLLDPASKYEVDCKTSLPMNGYSTCADGKTSFIYGGVSYQYGETWLSVQRSDVDDCPVGVNATSTSESGTVEHNPQCKQRSATGTLNLPSNFWQQPGWNSWVHPEALDMNWSWAT